MNPRSDGRSGVAGLSSALLILLVLPSAGFVAVARYTSLLDPAAPGVAPASLSARHLPPAPCLRYPSMPTASSIDSAATALALAGFTSSEVGPVIGDLYARAAARELPLHANSELEEYLDAMAAQSGLWGRVVIAVKRDRLRAQLTGMLRKTPVVFRTLASLPPQQRAALETEWSRDPSVFVLPGLLELTNALKLAVTNQRLDAAQASLQAQLAAGETPSLERLTERNDDWGNPFTLEGGTLSSLGRDGLVGGTGLYADLHRTIGANQTERPALAAPCAGNPNVSLERTQLEAALEDVQALSAGARVVPVFENGVSSGFRLTQLRPDSFFVRAGLCDGDVVRSLNGIALSSPDRALEAYTTLEHASVVEVALTRGGAPFTLVVRVR